MIVRKKFIDDGPFVHELDLTTSELVTLQKALKGRYLALRNLFLSTNNPTFNIEAAESKYYFDIITIYMEDINKNE